MSQDLRSALAAYEAAGQLVHVKEPISAEFEAAAVLWRLGRGPAAVLEQITGYDTPIVGNVLNTREKLACALGLAPGDLQAHLVDAVRNPVPVEIDDAPACQQQVLEAPFDLLRRFPIPRISEHDGGRYISAGVVVVRDPRGSRQNAAICRLQVRDGDELGIYMAPTHSAQFLQGWREVGRPMEIAIALGSHPAVLAASQMLVPTDELEIAGGIFGAPLRVAHCRTVDLVVPAGSEIVLEGTIDPDELVEEGPFGEFPGTYAPVRRNPVVRLTGVTTRTDPVLQIIVGGTHPEHLITGAVAREVTLRESIRTLVPGVEQVVLTEGGTCRFHAVVQLKQRFPGESRLAALTALTAQDLIKQVIVVDDDIDPLDPVAVEWAVATRCRAPDDLVMVPGMKSNPVDPMSVDRTICKVVIDATLPVGSDPARRVTPDVPESVRQSIAERWDRLL